MSIVKHKWKPQWNCTVIEKFYYTETGQFFTHDQHAFGKTPLGACTEDVHEGRIMLERTKQGKFFVDWSTRNMFKIEHEVLGLCRETLKEFLDGLRTKSLVTDIETWTKVILWSFHGHAVRAATALDAEGKMLRLAIWDDTKKAFVPKQDLIGYGHSMDYEPYTVERWRQVESVLTLHKEFESAEKLLQQELMCFRLRDHNTAHQKAMRSLRDSMRKQTLALQKERADQERARKQNG